jgi:hypothetical protein
VLRGTPMADAAATINAGSYHNRRTGIVHAVATMMQEKHATVRKTLRKAVAIWACTTACCSLGNAASTEGP